MWIFLPNNSSFHLELKFIFHITIFVKFSSQKPKIPHLQNSSFFLLTHTTYKIFKNNSYFICGENIYSFVIEFSSCGNIKSIADNIEVYDEKTFALRTFFLLFSQIMVFDGPTWYFGKTSFAINHLSAGKTFSQEHLEEFPRKIYTK